MASKEDNVEVVKQKEPKEKFQLALSEIYRKTSLAGSQDSSQAILKGQIARRMIWSSAYCGKSARWVVKGGPAE